MLTFLIFWTSFSLFLIFSILLAPLIILICNYKIFTNYYHEKGWKSFIPIYSDYVRATHTFGKNYGWLGLLYAIIEYSSLLTFFLGGPNLSAYSLSMYYIQNLYQACIYYKLFPYNGTVSRTLLSALATLAPFIGLPTILFVNRKRQIVVEPYFANNTASQEKEKETEINMNNRH